MVIGDVCEVLIFDWAVTQQLATYILVVYIICNLTIQPNKNVISTMWLFVLWIFVYIVQGIE